MDLRGSMVHSEIDVGSWQSPTQSGHQDSIQLCSIIASRKWWICAVVGFRQWRNGVDLRGSMLQAVVEMSVLAR